MKSTLFLFALLLFACDTSEDTNQNNQTDLEEPTLIAIQRQNIFVSNPSINNTSTTTITNGRVEKIEYSIGNLDTFEYTDGNLSYQSNYLANDDVTRELNYAYDDQGRLTEMQVRTSIADGYLRITFQHLGNTITQFMATYTDANELIQNLQSYTFELSGNLVTDYYSSPITTLVKALSFDSGNSPATFRYEISGQTYATANYQVRNTAASSAYHIGKYLFNDNWELNTVLMHVISSTIDHDYVLNISSNYVEGYEYNNTTNDIQESLAITYEFLNDNIILSQTQNKTRTSSGNVEEFISIYNYIYDTGE